MQDTQQFTNMWNKHPNKVWKEKMPNTNPPSHFKEKNDLAYISSISHLIVDKISKCDLGNKCWHPNCLNRYTTSKHAMRVCHITQLCNYGPYCTNMNCQYVHPGHVNYYIDKQNNVRIILNDPQNNQQNKTLSCKFGPKCPHYPYCVNK